MINLYEQFKRTRTERPQDVAFMIAAGDRSLPISWKQFTDDIATISFIIEKNTPSRPIALLGENSYEWMVAHAACLFSEATVAPIDINLSAQEIADRLTTINAGVLVYSSLYAEKKSAVAALLPHLVTAGFGTRKTDFFLNAAQQAVELGLKTVWDRKSPPDAERTSMLIFTSGTTSKPRAVELSIRNIETFCTCWSDALKMKRHDRSLMLLPLHHIFGLCTAYLMLVNSVAIGVCPDFRRIYDAVERFRARFLFLVPALAEILAAKIARHGPNAETALGFRIDWILTGGAPQPRRTYDQLAELGVRVITAYGMTETCALFSVEPSVGRPHPGQAGRAASIENVECRVADDGELQIRGPNVFKGYFGLPEKTAESFTGDGWFRTGDLGEIDKDGFVQIKGRRTRTIVLSSGKKVAPEELEEALLALSGIMEALVTGDSITREIHAAVYGPTLTQEQAEHVIREFNMTQPVHKRITRITVRREPFPRTASGKIKLERPDELENRG